MQMPLRKIVLYYAFYFVMALFLIGGCASPDVDSVAAADAPPIELPAGEDGSLQIAQSGPPLRRPSLGNTVAGQPEKLELPSIGVESDVVPIGWYAVQQVDGTQSSEWEVADYAAGWHKNSAHPGEKGNVVLSGHNNIRGAVFKKLYTMKPGDKAYLWSGGQRFTYNVEEVMILEEKFASIEQRRQNARWIQPFDDERLTLVSCWPEDDNTHRVIVVAKRVAE
jgi:sortase A